MYLYEPYREHMGPPPVFGGGYVCSSF